MCKTAVFALAFLAAAWGQTPPGGRQLTARELFYAGTETPSAPAAAPKAAETKPPRQRKAATPSREAKAPAATARPDTPTAPAEGAAPPRMTGGASYVPAAYPAGGPRPVPLGIRYTILKLIDGRMTDVAPDSVFHAGDRIQVSVEANSAGYLYIVHQGSSGTWKPLFPSPEVEEGSNHIEKGRTYVMPPKSRFYFDEQAGEEKLFIVLSRQPEPDLEKLVYKLQDGGKPAAPAADAAAPTPPRPAMMLASNLQISDGLVGRLRNVYARDLVVEKVDDEATPPTSPASAGRREKAVYVVNASGAADARVVADLRLTHR